MYEVYSAETQELVRVSFSELQEGFANGTLLPSLPVIQDEAANNDTTDLSEQSDEAAETIKELNLELEQDSETAQDNASGRTKTKK